jgi:hypothetical protein
LRRKRPGTLGGGLSVVAVGGAAAPAPRAHLTAPYQPHCMQPRPAMWVDVWPMWVDVGSPCRDPPRRMVVASMCRVDVGGGLWVGCGATLPGIRRAAGLLRRERPGTLGGGLSVVAVRGEAAPAPQAHLTAPYPWLRGSRRSRRRGFREQHCILTFTHENQFLTRKSRGGGPDGLTRRP